MYVRSKVEGISKKAYECIQGRGGCSKNVRTLKYFSNAEDLKNSLSKHNRHLQLYRSSPWLLYKAVIILDVSAMYLFFRTLNVVWWTMDSNIYSSWGVMFLYKQVA